MREEAGGSRRQLWLGLVFAVIAAVEVSLTILLFRNTTPDLVAAVVIVAALLAVSPRLFDIASFDVSPSGLKATLNSLTERVEKQESDIAELFAMAMGKPMYDNLKRLHDGNFPYVMSEGLQRELYHLRTIGYIDVNGGIRNIPESGRNLAEYAQITDHGEEFVRLRESYENRDQP